MKNTSKKKFKIPGYQPSKPSKKPSEQAYLPPLPEHLQKIFNRPKNIERNRYYFISTKAKETIEKLEGRWRRKQLNSSELAQFYDSINDLLICARTEEDHNFKKEGLESCLDLLMKLLEPFIKAEVNFFVLTQGLISSIDSEEKRKDIKEEWLRYAKRIVILEILGDQLTRPDRAEEIKPYLIESKPSEKRRLSLRSRNLKSNLEKLFNTISVRLIIK